MIDTIKLAIPYDKYPGWLKHIQSRDAIDLATGTIKNIINPSSAAKKNGAFMPNVTYRQRPVTGERTHDLLIQISLPKLLFGNNFREVSDTDFEVACESLTNSLNSAGIPITIDQIRGADVRKIDFCKNVIFNNYTTVSSIVNDLRTADINKRSDSQLTDFRNGGYIYHMMHTNSLDVSLYDKIADLQQGKISDGRAHENDNYIQFKLLDTFAAQRSLSVARFEVRLNSKAKIRYELRRLGIDLPDTTFKSMYKSTVARAILNHYWQYTLDRIPKSPLDTDTPEKLLSEILKAEKITPQLAFAQLGYLLCIPGNDSRYIRNLIEQRFGKHAWHRLASVRPPPLDRSRLKNLLSITSAIEAMQPVDIDKFDFSSC